MTKKISRYAVELFINCKRCFVLTYKYNIKLRTLPFTLNSAVDNLCKNEFDFTENLKNLIRYLKNIILKLYHSNMMTWINGEIIG